MGRHGIARAALTPLIGAILALVAAPSMAAAPPLAAQDRQFFYWAREEALADAALCRLAVQQAQSAAVKRFAADALAAESRRAAALASLMKAEGLSPPQRPDKEDRALRRNIAATRGGDLDRILMRTLIGDTRRTIELYDQEAERGKSTTALGAVAEELPMLQRLDGKARGADLRLAGTAPLMSTSGTVSTHQPTPPPI